MIHSELKKMILFSFALLFLATGCAEIPDGIVDPGWNDNTITNLEVPNSFTYNSTDSTMSVSIEFNTTANIKSVFVSLKSDDSDVFEEPVILTQNSNVFNGEITFSYSLPSDVYSLEVFMEELDESIKHVATSQLNYDNGQTAYAPVISNLSLATTVARGESFIFSVDVTDQNGLADIERVIFKLYRPDGSVVESGAGIDYFQLVDNGNTEVFGDIVADDGTYSYKNSFGPTSTTGTWRFEFQAIDKSDLTSNVITQNIEVN